MPFGFGKRNIKKLERELNAEGLIALLYDEKLFLEASNALCNIGVAAMAPVLQALRNSESQLVTFYLSLALKEIGKPCVLPLIELLPELSPMNAGMAVLTLGLIGDPRALEPILGAMRDPSASDTLRNYAVGAFGEIGGARAEEILSDLIADGQLDASLRESAVRNLEESKAKRKG